MDCAPHRPLGHQRRCLLLCGLSLALLACSTPEPREEPTIRGFALPLAPEQETPKEGTRGIAIGELRTQLRLLAPEEAVTIVVRSPLSLDWAALDLLLTREGVARKDRPAWVSDALDVFADLLLRDFESTRASLEADGLLTGEVVVLSSLARLQVATTRAGAERLWKSGAFSLLEWVPEESVFESPEPPEPSRVLTTLAGNEIKGSAWAPAALGAPAAWAAGFDGRGTLVALLDGGWWPEHDALTGNFRRSGQLDEYRRPGTHGNAVISCAVGRLKDGTPLGTAPGAEWIAADPFAAGHHVPLRLDRVVHWVLTQRADVVVMSFDLEQGHQRGLIQALSAWRTAGISLVVAAGNLGPVPGRNDSPANLGGLGPENASSLAIGAVNEDLSLVMTSARGPSSLTGKAFPSLSAPGSTLLTAGAPPSHLEARSGTSFAAPTVGGLIALLRQAAPEASVAEIEQALQESARDLGQAQRDSNFGHGLPRAMAALNALGATLDSAPAAPLLSLSASKANRKDAPDVR